MTVLWRALAFAEEEARERGDAQVATTLREEAQEVVRSLAMSFTDEGLRSSLRLGFWSGRAPAG